MKTLLFVAVLRALFVPVVDPGNDNDPYSDREDRIDSTVVSASRAGAHTPVTYTMMSRKDLQSSSPMNSLPMALDLQPSVVTSSEGGTGLGYSKMKVRGSKGSQVNATLNGITLNDAESQEVFWVNIPSLGNMLSSVQLQRGLGTSASGAGAFGASINMNTGYVGSDPYASVDLGAGSFNTFTATAAAGTGLTKSGVYFDAAYSKNYTDGYIRNAYAKVQSAYAALGWMNETNSIRLTYLMGDQHTGITWNGISLAQMEKDRTYNPAGEYYDAAGNVHYYGNDTDNYTQHHLQLNYTHLFGHNVVWSTTFNWTKGDGWYDEYKTGKKFSKYGFSDEDLAALGTEYTAKTKGDFIVLKAMANNYFVANSQVTWKNRFVNFVGGVNVSQYNGNHYGDMKWSSLLGDGFDYSQLNYSCSAENDWYYSRTVKREANVFARAEVTPVPWMTAYADLQYRGVFLNMGGVDDEDDAPLDYKTNWQFFNPRAGLTFSWNPAHKAYVSAALGHREPGRSDIKEVIITNNWGGSKDELKPEKMVDLEIGYQYTGAKVVASANVYLMEYWDMLLETGKLSDVGYAIKENVGRSYRRGIELAAAWQATPWMKLEGNFALSLNKIKDYTAYFDSYDNMNDWNPIEQHTEHYDKTTMLMSPSIVGMAQVAFTPFKTICNNSLKTTTLAVNAKYVGKQYWDNTQCEDRSMPGYYVTNLSLTHEFTLGREAGHELGDGYAGHLGLGLYVNNFTNNMYYADAWVYNAYFRDENVIYSEEGIFPQAPVNFMFKVSYRF